jgi:hypothetical protein
MQFKKRDRSLREIGEQLGAATLLEGSVRRAGNRVRIVAQLIDRDSDEHIWAETYDRDLTDIFAIQTDVALQIAGALRAELSVANATESGSSRRTTSKRMSSSARPAPADPAHAESTWRASGSSCAIAQIPLVPAYATWRSRIEMGSEAVGRRPARGSRAPAGGAESARDRRHASAKRTARWADPVHGGLRLKRAERELLRALS